MQENISHFAHFCSKRTDRLADATGLNLQDLPEITGISRRMIFAYRKGDRPISAKAWAKLEMAEMKAGLDPSTNGPVAFVRGPSYPLPGEKDDIPMVAEKPRTIEDRLEAIESGLREITRMLSEGRKPGTYPLPNVGKAK